MRKEFALEKPVVAARLYITALGLFEAYLNGHPVGQDLLAPGWIDYHHRVRYHVYDVTSLLTNGQNAIGVILGDGWYCGHVAWHTRQLYGDRPRLLAQLHCMLANGTTTIIASNNTWKSTFGPLLESDLFMGESYDARIEAHDLHLTTGFVGTPYLPHVLTTGGRVDIAYKLLVQETWPSWLYSVTQGATTIWERWDGWTHDKGFQNPMMNSYHYAYGSIGAWLYAVVAGIDADLDHPDFNPSACAPSLGEG